MEDKQTTETGIGYLKVRVSTAQGSVPLSGASVVIRNTENGDIVKTASTNDDGLTPKIALETRPRQESESPGQATPFLTYDMDVFLPGYYTQFYRNIPIFDGISAIQSVQMIPLPQNGYDLSLSPDDERFFEGENPAL